MLSLSEDGFLVIQLGGFVVFGGICAAIAAGRGRSAVGWFFVGAFTGCVGLILVMVLPDMKVQEAREKRQRLETRKLREQLKKERQVADQRHQHVERRLGAHDEAMGLDTSDPPQLPLGADPAQLTDSDQASANEWYYARDNERLGPVSEETLRHLLAANAIDGDSLTWRDGMADWTPIRDVAQFRGDVS